VVGWRSGDHSRAHRAFPNTVSSAWSDSRARMRWQDLIGTGQVSTPHPDEDWRLTMRFKAEHEARGIFTKLRVHAAAAEAATELQDFVFASRDGVWVRAYAGTYDGLRRAQRVIGELVVAQRLEVDEIAEHRRAASERWEQVELSPLSPRERSVCVRNSGVSSWGAEAEPERVEVRFELPDHQSCIDFATKLRREGYEIHRRGSYLFMFADNREAAIALGNVLKQQAPSDAQLYFSGAETTLIF
jgi:hypothetical protein